MLAGARIFELCQYPER